MSTKTHYKKAGLPLLSMLFARPILKVMRPELLQVLGVVLSVIKLGNWINLDSWWNRAGSWAFERGVTVMEQALGSRPNGGSHRRGSGDAVIEVTTRKPDPRLGKRRSERGRPRHRPLTQKRRSRPACGGQRYVPRSTTPVDLGSSTACDHVRGQWKLMTTEVRALGTVCPP